MVHWLNISFHTLEKLVFSLTMKFSSQESSGTSGGGGGVVFAHPLDDLSPFFQKQYVKGHSADVFSSYNRLVAEILLVLPCQVRVTRGYCCFLCDNFLSSIA